MKLDTVQIHHFRNLKDVILQPCSSLNFILGSNGSGKSSFLEALHYLGFGRSFRTTKHKNVVQYGEESFSVFCSSTGEQGKKLKLGISRGRDESLLVSVNGIKTKRISELVAHIPIQIFTPQSSDLIIGSPSLRRRFLDWGLFHVEHSFADVSQSYSKLLRQKNALLKNRQLRGGHELTQQVAFWDKQLAKTGELLSSLRKSFLEGLLPYINANLVHFLPEFSCEISYHKGWEKDHSLEESIAKKKDRDSRNGYLSVGPHKADLKIKYQGIDVSESFSRGQLRMLVAALQLAQIQYLSEVTRKSCIFLLDDIGAELDEVKRELFIDKLLECNTQLFVTAIEASQLLFTDKYNDKKMFHVEHGQLREEN